MTRWGMFIVPRDISPPRAPVSQLRWSQSRSLVKQNHPGYSGAQIKSALVNTGSQSVISDDSGNAANILETGGGEVKADLASQTNVTVVPSTLSFGALTSGVLPINKTLQVTNTGTSALTLTVAKTATGATASSTNLSLDKTTLALAAGASGTVSIMLSGSCSCIRIVFGRYYDFRRGCAAASAHLFLVGSRTAANFTPLLGDNNDGTTGQVLPDGAIAFQVTDGNGVPGR